MCNESLQNNCFSFCAGFLQVKEQLVRTERNGPMIASGWKQNTSETGLSMSSQGHHPQLLWEQKAVCNLITFADPSLTVRADITGRYSNRLYTYEPQDIPFCKCPPLLTCFAFHLVGSQIHSVPLVCAWEFTTISEQWIQALCKYLQWITVV